MSNYLYNEVGGALCTLYLQSKRAAVKRGIPFTLSEQDFARAVKRADGHCAVTGIKFSNNLIGDSKKRPYAPSLDRIDSQRGYEAGNVRIVCVSANLAMNEWGDEVITRIKTATAPDEVEPDSLAPVRYLTRDEAAEFVTAQHGVPCSPKTLAKLATVGGGPLYRKFGHRAVYSAADLNTWVEGKLTPARQSTSGSAI